MKKTLLIFTFLLCFVTIQAQENSTDLFFTQGSEWKYLDNGSNQGTAWRASNFNDSQWETGSGHFGFGDGDEDTLLQSGFVTYYFRKKVMVENVDDLETIIFHIIHDDGAVVYVNGVEVIRSELMPQGEINYLTGTTTFVPNDQENSFFSYPVNKSYFVSGENSIAIEIHNQKPSSSDVSFDCKITASNESAFNPDGPYVFYRNNQVEVKTITAEGLNTQYYATKSEAQLTINLPDELGSFAVSLKPTLTTEPYSYTLPQKFLAVSDIEGEMAAFVMLLKDSGVIDANYNWAFGQGHLFISGDMFDRGKYVTESLWLLYKLESEAETAGGKVHFVLGNHDIMNIIGDFRYVNAKYTANAALMSETLLSLYAEDTELGRWIRTKNIIEQAEQFVFLHGGISPQVKALNLGYLQLNDWGRTYMASAGNCLTQDCTTVNKTNGLYWYRGMAQEALTQLEVDGILEAFGAEKIVIGHTIFDEITLLYNEKVIAIDLAHGKNFKNGFMNGLYYENNQMYEFHTNGVIKNYNPLGQPMTLGVIEESLNTPLKVYPNPVQENFTIKWDSNLLSTENAQIILYDLSGKMIYNKTITPSLNETVIEASALQKGIYSLQINFNGQVVHKKLIKS